VDLKSPKLDYFACKAIDLGYKDLKKKMKDDIESVRSCFDLSGIFKLELLDLKKEEQIGLGRGFEVVNLKKDEILIDKMYEVEYGFKEG